MLCNSIARHLWTICRRFAGADQGNIAVIFAIANVLVLSVVGAAIDFSRVTAARTAMQGALDSAALMVAKDLSSGIITTSQVNAKAQSYVTGLYTRTGVQSISIDASYTSASGSTASTVSINGSGSITTDFLMIVGFPILNFNVSSTVTSGASRLRVALVLDNTGSMSDSNKIGALQTAATNLVTQLSALARNSGDVYISVVPFALDVNVGTSNVNAAWLRWDRWDPLYGSSSNTYCNDSGWSETLADCQDRGHTWKHTPTNTSDHSKWNGCVADRDQNNDVNSVAPSTSDKSTLFIADQEPFCPATAVLPLTYDWTAVKSRISAMSPNGGTNQTIGLQWGWFSLLQQDPLNAPAEQTGGQYQHVIVLFTDGLNSEDRWYGDPNYSPQVDTRMKILCDNIKASGVTLFTIQIDTDHAGQSAVLPYCASGPSNFFLLTQPSQIGQAFQQIGTQISKLRVAK